MALFFVATALHIVAYHFNLVGSASRPEKQGRKRGKRK